MREPRLPVDPCLLDTPEKWTIHPALNRLEGPTGSHQLEPRVMRLLLCLVAAGGQPVSRDDLLERVWGETFVAEGSLTLAISALRKILGDSPGEPRFIETIRKVGYRLLPAVLPCVEAEARAPSKDPGPRRWTVAGGVFLVVAVTVAAVAVGLVAMLPLSDPPAPRSPIVPVPETSLPGMEVGASLSPDGEMLAFSHWRVKELRHRILLKHRATEVTEALPGEPDYEGEAAWSPTGDRLAFVRCEARQCGVFIQALAGGEARWVTDLTEASPSCLWWLPDGRALVIADRGGAGQPFQLWLVQIEGGARRPLVAPGVEAAPPLEDLGPRVSPDGQRVLFVRGDLVGGGERGLFGVLGHLYTVPSEGGEATRLSPTAGEIFGASWLPSGRGVVYSVRSPWGWEVRRLDVDGAAASTLLYQSEGLLRNPLVSPSGEVIVESWRGDRNLRRMELPSGKKKTFLDSTRDDAEPAISPDGTRVAFLSARTGSWELWLWDQRTGTLHPLTAFGGAVLRTPRWSLDGRALAFVVQGPKSGELYTLAIDPPGRPQRLMEWPGTIMVSSWSRDGRWIYLGSDRTGGWQVWRVGSGGVGAERMTPAGGIAAFEVGEDPEGGTRLLYSKPMTDGLWEGIFRQGPIEREVFVPVKLRAFDALNWGVVEAGVYYLAREEDHPGTLRLWDPVTAQDRALASLPWLPTVPRSVTLFANGSALLYCELQDLQADLVSFPLEPE
jgi:Tol biopolymer transport system component/DNA-binding winged helix-turn-helix (wHTH) protein